MKTYLGILVLLLVARGSLASTCHALNPFLKTSPTYLVLAYPQSVSLSECRFAWNGAKSCCSSSGMKKHWDLDRNSISAGKKILKDAINQIREKIKGPFKDNKEVLHNPILRFYKDIRSTTYHDKFLQSVDKCWDSMAWGRARSLCYTCSADSSVFFEAGKARVTMESCTSMLNKCDRFFEYSMNFIQGMKDIDAAVSTMTSYRSDFREMGHWLREITKVANSNEIIGQLSTYQQSYDPEQKNQAASLICNSLLNVFKPSFIEYITPLIRMIESKTDEIIKGVSTVFNSRLLKMAIRPSASRSLFLAGNGISDQMTAAAIGTDSITIRDLHSHSNLKCQWLDFSSSFP